MTHLQREIERLKRKILALGAIVEENLRLAVQAIETRDVQKARKVIATDLEIDENEVEVEEECLKLLALYQPVAKDLRFIIAVVKINSELERIGDLAANVAERAEQLAAEYPVPVPRSLPVISDRVRSILEGVLDALVQQDAVQARKLLAADDEVDELYRQLLEELKDELRADLDHLDAIVLLFSVARYMERLADHANNIAEDVLYMVEGEILRHQLPDTPAELLGLSDRGDD
jgi:phosphate transport system protein